MALVTSNFGSMYLIGIGVVAAPMKLRSPTATLNKQSSSKQPIRKRHIESKVIIYHND
jgi:hypothetical protein